MSTHHVFLTRFNLPSEGNESLIRAKEGWLRNRWSLFERYTMPSVRRQTAASAAWLVYLDVDSPGWLLDRMGPLVEEGLLTTLFRTTVPAEDLCADISQAVRGAPGDILITSNLDNDDGLARSFVARLLGVERVPERTAVYLTNGLIKASERLYLRHDRRNAFCTVREPLSAPMTCWSDWHNLLHRSMPVHEVNGAPAWLQVIHGENVSNRVRGRLVSPAPYRRDFDDLIADVPEIPRSELVADRLVRAPVRLSREGVRASGKQVIMRVAGKDGLDRIKETLTGRRRS